MPSPPKAAACRVAASAAISFRPTPPTRDGVDGKKRAATSPPRPTASKMAAPRYDWTVEIPILASTLSRPFETAWT